MCNISKYNNTINITITTSGSLTLTPGNGITAYVNTKASSKIARGSYSTNLTATTAEGVNKNITLNFEVLIGYCEYGSVGDYFDLEIKEPKTDDEF